MDNQTWMYSEGHHEGKYTGIMNNKWSEYEVRGHLDKNSDYVLSFPKHVYDEYDRVEKTIEELDLWLDKNHIQFPDFFLINTNYTLKSDDRPCLKIMFNDKTKRTNSSIKDYFLDLWFKQLERDDFPFEIDKQFNLIFLKEVQ